MDILLTPQDPAFPPDKTPYVCAEYRKWDCGQFLTYANNKREGRLRSVPLHLRKTSAGQAGQEPFSEVLYPTPQEEQQRFYQTWFWFGLLAEFFGLNEQPDGRQRAVPVDQAKRDLSELYPDGGTLTGKALKPMADKYMWQRLAAHKKDPADWQAHLEHWRECLQFTHAMVSGALHSPFDERILFAITALGETFTSSVNQLVILCSKELSISMPRFTLPWKFRFCAIHSSLETRMLEHDWCRSHIERMRAQYQEVHTLHLISRLKKSGPVIDHSECSTVACRGGKLSVGSYRLAHVEEHCECSEYPSDDGMTEEVQRILHETGTFPVLNFVRTQQGVSVVVEQYVDGTPYVALSHVWADGLGNPHKNAIYTCQISRLARLLADLQTLTATKSLEGGLPTIMQAQEPYRLWIDTLCCPIDAETNKVALSRIVQVYANARHVLVLDASITPFRAEGMHAAEQLLRMFSTSAWMRRL